MNHRKHKQTENLKKKLLSPSRSIPDPLEVDAVCPYCGKYDKSCSYVNSASRAYARGACKKKIANK